MLRIFNLLIWKSSLTSTFIVQGRWFNSRRKICSI